MKPFKKNNEILKNIVDTPKALNDIKEINELLNETDEIHKKPSKPLR